MTDAVLPRLAWIRRSPTAWVSARPSVLFAKVPSAFLTMGCWRNQMLMAELEPLAKRSVPTKRSVWVEPYVA